jgi:hypothetical protein
MLQVGEMRLKALILQGLFIQLRSKCAAFWVFMRVACVVRESGQSYFLTPSLELFNCATSIFFFGIKKKHKEENFKLCQHPYQHFYKVNMAVNGSFLQPVNMLKCTGLFGEGRNFTEER